MTRETGADRLCDTLLSLGIDTCFANPGTSEMHFVAALDRRLEMNCVLGLSEGVVTGMADGYARMAGKPAATLLHCGPGLANGLANLHNARRGYTPIVNVVGDHATYHVANDPLLASDIESFASPVSTWVGRAMKPAQVSERAGAAWRAALARPGVATLILPGDAAWGEIDPDAASETPDATPPARAVPDAEAVGAAAEALRGGSRSAILLGGDAQRGEALEAAGRIAAATGCRLLAPVFSTRMERGAGRPMLERIPYPVDAAVTCLADLDAVVFVGADEPVAFFAYPGKPTHLLPDACRRVAFAAPGDDLTGAMGALAAATGAEGDAVHATAGDGLPDAPSGRLDADAVSAVVAWRIPEGAIICDESISSAPNFYAFSRGAPAHDYLQLTGGAIGTGIPLAAGAAMGAPGRRVIALQADGSALYTVQGLWSQARERLDVVTIILSNRTYAILEGEMANVGVASIGRNARRMFSLDGPALDWPTLARGFGVPAERVETAEDLDAALARAVETPGPVLIEALMA